MLVFNSHVPSTAATVRRKRDLVEKLMDLGNEAQGSGVAQPAADAWIVGGDLKLSEAQLLQYSSFYVQPGTKCFSNSSSSSSSCSVSSSSGSGSSSSSSSSVEAQILMLQSAASNVVAAWCYQQRPATSCCKG